MGGAAERGPRPVLMRAIPAAARGTSRISRVQRIRVGFGQRRIGISKDPLSLGNDAVGPGNRGTEAIHFNGEASRHEGSLRRPRQAAGQRQPCCDDPRAKSRKKAGDFHRYTRGIAKPPELGYSGRAPTVVRLSTPYGITWHCRASGRLLAPHARLLYCCAIWLPSSYRLGKRGGARAYKKVLCSKRRNWGSGIAATNAAPKTRYKESKCCVLHNSAIPGQASRSRSFPRRKLSPKKEATE